MMLVISRFVGEVNGCWRNKLTFMLLLMGMGFLV